MIKVIQYYVRVLFYLSGAFDAVGHFLYFSLGSKTRLVYQVKYLYGFSPIWNSASRD